MHRLIITFTLLLTTLAAWCSDFLVSGQATGRDGVGEPFATLRVNLKDSTVKTIVTVADGEGRFKITLPSSGFYRLEVSAVGKQDLKKEFTITAAQPAVDLGQLIMESATKQLEEVVVTAKKPVVKREIDRVTYDVTQDPDASSNPLSEILRKVPLVSVEPDGTVKVMGSESFTIYKNGRPNESLNKNHKDIFKSIPASAISKIEVITDPGAREDAQGGGVVLNIVTTHQMYFKGVTGTLGYNTTNHHKFVPQPYAYLTTQIHNVTLSLNGGNNYQPVASNNPTHSTSWRQFDSGQVMKSSSHRSSHGVSNSGSLEMSWEPDTLNLLNVEAWGYYYSMTDNSYNSSSMFSPAGKLEYSFDNYSKQFPMRGYGFSGSVNYQRSTRLKDETITLSYRLSNMWDRTGSYAEYYNLVDYPVDYTQQDGFSHDRFVEHTVQLDWKRPLGSMFSLDLGGKGIFRRQNNQSLLEYIPVREEMSDFHHNYDIVAGFFDLRFSKKRINGRIGLRYEYSRLEAQFKDGSSPNFAKNLNDWVPNVAFQWNATDQYCLKLGYGTSISRPSITSLNPLRIETPTSVSYGNPDLASALYHSLTLSQSYFSSKVNTEFTFNYRFSNSAVASWRWSEGPIMYSTEANRGRRRDIYFNSWTGWNMTAKTYLSLNLYVAYNYRNLGPGELAYGSWTYGSAFNLTQQLPWDLTLSVRSTILPSTRSMYSTVSYRYNGAWINYGVSLQRQFLKEKRLTVQVRVNNPFKHNTETYKTTWRNCGYTGEGWDYISNNTFVGLGLSLRFGSLNAQVKQTAATISNTDNTGIGKR